MTTANFETRNGAEYWGQRSPLMKGLTMWQNGTVQNADLFFEALNVPG